METVNPLYGTTTKHSLVTSLERTRQEGWIADQSRRCSTGTVGEKKLMVSYTWRGAKDMQLQQNDRQTFVQWSLSLIHSDDLVAQRAKFNLQFRDRWRQKHENREMWGKPNQVAQGSSQKLKNGDGTQNTGLRTFYVFPSVLYTQIIYTEVRTYVHTMHFSDYTNEPPLLHMFLHTQELARHVTLN